MKKPPKYEPLTFESDITKLPLKRNGDRSGDTSANLYMSMLLSRAWRGLTDRQKVLYLYCKAQYYGEKPDRKTHMTQAEIDGGANVNLMKRFTMNRNKWSDMYELYSESTSRYFWRDMNALIEKGFIRKVESGKTTRTKNIYEFADDWRKL